MSDLKLTQEIRRLEADALVELYVLDATELGGGLLRFHCGTGQNTLPIVFQGFSYNPLPVEVKGFEIKVRGELPRPSVKFANVSGLFTGLVLSFGDLIGARLIRKRTFRRFLDDGSAPDPACEFPQDIYLIERKVSENKLLVEFECSTSLDVDGLKLPRRVVSSGFCHWAYRSASCGFAGQHFVADRNDLTYSGVTPFQKYRGEYLADVTYQPGECTSLSFSDRTEYYYNIATTAITGLSPTQSAYWVKAQTFRGQWRATDDQGEDVTYYANDSVYITGAGGLPYYFLLVVPRVSGEYGKPPNTLYWKPDQCSKLLSGCRLRHDPLTQNNPLPFGGFPGTSRVPLL